MISVIIPMHNSAATIERCLASVMKQSYKDTEMIVIDDGSTDDGAQIVIDLSKKDSRIKYIWQENGGVSAARNHGLEEAQGEWICFIDSDDEVEEEYLSSLYLSIVKTNSDIAMCGYREVRADGVTEYLLSEKEMTSLTGDMSKDFETLRQFALSPWMKIFRKEKIEKIHLRFCENMVLAEDIYFNYHYYSLCKTVSFVNRAQYIYYRTDSGLSKAVSLTCFENEMDNLSYMICYLENAHIERGESIIAEYICRCMRRYAIIPGEKNTIASFRARLKRIRQFDKPAKRLHRLDPFLYLLFRKRCYFVLFIYYQLYHRIKM